MSQLSTTQLTAPTDYTLKLDTPASFIPTEASITRAPTWGVPDPHVVAMSELQKGMERFADIYDQTQATDFMIKARQDLDQKYFNPDTGLFYTRKGADAQGLYQEYYEDAKRITDEMAPSMLNARQQRLVNEPLSNMFLEGGKRVASFEVEQHMNSVVDQIKNNNFNIQDMIGQGDLKLDTLGFAISNMKSNFDALAKVQGWDEETTKRNFQQAMFSAFDKGARATALFDPQKALGAWKFLMNTPEMKGAVTATQYNVGTAHFDKQAWTYSFNTIAQLIQQGNFAEAGQLMQQMGWNGTNLPKGGGVGGAGVGAGIPQGMTDHGNIPFEERYMLTNSKGLGTAKTEVLDIGEGKFLLIPAVSPDGMELDRNSAIEQYKNTNKFYGEFTSQGNAERYSMLLQPSQEARVDAVKNTIGYKLNNPGNIGKTGQFLWQDEVANAHQRYKGFATPEAGIAAIVTNLRDYRDNRTDERSNMSRSDLIDYSRNLTRTTGMIISPEELSRGKAIRTLEQYNYRWSPPNENNTAGILRDLCQYTGMAPDTIVNLNDEMTLYRLVSGLIKREIGAQPYSQDVIMKGIRMGLAGKQ